MESFLGSMKKKFSVIIMLYGGLLMVITWPISSRAFFLFITFQMNFSHYEIRSNETDVPEFDFPYYEGNPYPTSIKIKYPKPGYPNPTVQLWVYHVASEESFHLVLTFSSHFLLQRFIL